MILNRREYTDPFSVAKYWDIGIVSGLQQRHDALLRGRNQKDR